MVTASSLSTFINALLPILNTLLTSGINAKLWSRSNEMILLDSYSFIDCACARGRVSVSLYVRVCVCKQIGEPTNTHLFNKDSFLDMT